jgi:glycosyltransferase involved in cell wall biosynthesis
LNIAPPDRIRALVSPIDPIAPLSAASRDEARRLLGLPTGAKVIGTVARLEKQKAPLDMVKAFAALRRPDVYMAWIGGGKMREETQRYIDRKGLKNRFLLLGERKDVPTLLPAFDVFALSSLFEGLPTVLAEAMTCGVPVVSTAVNSVPEVVIAGRTGLLARPGDPKSLTRGLRHLLDEPEHAAAMAKAARAHIGERFQPEILGEDLTEIYEFVLRDQRGS